LGGDLEFSFNDNLNSISALIKLHSIHGNFLVYDNDLLPSFTGLENIDTIQSIFYLIGNDALTDLQGLDGLTYVGGEMKVQNNDHLESLNHLNNLNKVNGDLIVYSNELIQNMSGLENLHFVGGTMDIEYNPALINLSGLEGLDSIGMGLTIHSNNQLDELDSLNHLVSINGKLLIDNNVDLNTLNGLENIDANSITDLTITANDDLTECAILSICNYLINPNGNVHITYNSSGCNNIQQVEADCITGIESQNDLGQKDFIVHYYSSSDLLFIEKPIEILKSVVSVYNLNSQELIRQELLLPTTIINLNHLKDGYYVIRIISDKNVKVDKFLKN